MHFLWGVLFAYLLIVFLGAFGKIELKFKTGPPKPKPPKPPPKEKPKPPPKNQKNPFEGVRLEVIRSGRDRYMVTSKNGKVTDRILCAKDDWERTVIYMARLQGLTKVGDWAWEWRGQLPLPPGCHTTTYQYDQRGNLIGKETVYHS